MFGITLPESLWIVIVIMVVCLCHVLGEKIATWEMARARRKRG
jgi:hypothetical protein